MKHFSLLALVAATLLFSACSSKKYFEPDNTFSASHVSHSYGGDIVDLSRDGGTLSNGTYLGKSGVNAIDLGEGYRFLNESNAYILAANTEGLLKIIDKQTKEPIRAVSLHVPVVSATIQNGIIAYILNNNTFGIYQMNDNRKVAESRSEQTFAVDTRAASPMFIENLDN